MVYRSWRFFINHEMCLARETVKGNRSQSWNGVPPGTMKMQLRILRLCLRMTVEAMGLIYRAVAMVNFQSRSFGRRSDLRMTVPDSAIEVYFQDTFLDFVVRKDGGP